MIHMGSNRHRHSRAGMVRPVISLAARREARAIARAINNNERVPADTRAARASQDLRPAPAAPTVADMVAIHRPEDPMWCFRPGVLSATAGLFVGAFSQAVDGDVLYAVKCNPEPAALKALWDGGVRHFDVASLGEVRLARGLFPDATLHYMHPVKGRQAIRAAYHDFAVRDFVLDDADELAKIVEETARETDEASDLGLIIRLALPKGAAVYDLSGKFGAERSEAVRLLRAARPLAARLGVSFHVGSQMLDPEAYVRALDLAAEVIAEAGVVIDVVDVGGGFPVSYPGETPPPLDAFMEAIGRGVANLRLCPLIAADARFWCEPGRALVAAGVSLVVQVTKRKGNVLHVNDGVYGGLSDASRHVGFRFPTRVVTVPANGDTVRETEPEMAFSFYGPTCDSADFMPGPFILPADVAAGDWIEIGQLGAYGACLATAFNGFDQAVRVEVSDPPLLQTPGHGMEIRAA